MVSILNTIMHQKLTGFLKSIRLRPKEEIKIEIIAATRGKGIVFLMAET